MTPKFVRLVLLISSLFVIIAVIGACAPQEPEVQTVVETVVVKEPGEETVRIETVVVTVEPEIPTPEPGPKTLRVNIGTYPDIIDPQKSSFVNEIAHLKLIYEGLTKLNGQLETVPGAAESWEYNEDATELTFTLREGLKYSDGSVLNAMRFRDSLLRNINPETAGEYAAITDEVLGAPEWRMGEGDVAVQGEELVKESVQALDMNGNPCTDYEQEDCRMFKIKLAAPAPYFHTVMSLWVVYPAKAELIAEGGDNWWNSSKYHIGNGPYIMTSLEPFVRGYFVPNPSYWDGIGKVDIEFSYITDTAVQFQAYKNDEFDIVILGAEDLPTVQADPVLSQEAMIYPGNCTMGIHFHMAKEPFTDPKVRQAFATALNREGYVEDVLKTLGNPTLTWIPAGFPGHNPGESRYAFDPGAAKALLAESSYESLEALPPIVDTFGDTPRNRVRHEWLVAKWKEALGVDITLNPVENTTYTALTKNVETAPQMFLLGWCSDYPDPQNWLSVYFKSTTSNAEDIAYANPDFDALVNEADTTIDQARRMELYQQAQDVILDDSVVAFMYNTVNAYLVKPWVLGLETTPQDSDWPGSNNPVSIDIDTNLMP